MPRKRLMMAGNIGMVPAVTLPPNPCTSERRISIPAIILLPVRRPTRGISKRSVWWLTALD